MTTVFKIYGVVREKESGIGIGNLMVKAYDKDLLYDDLMGNAFTRPDGTFEIVSEAEDFRDFFEKRPDIYLRIMTFDGKREIYSTKSSVRWEARRVEYFEADIPRTVLGDLSPRIEPRLTDETGAVRTDYDVGESLIFGVNGLLPAHVYDVSIVDSRDQIVISSRLITDRNGQLPPNVAWPQMGLGNTNETYSFATHEEAEKALASQKFTIRVEDQGKTVVKVPFHFADVFHRRVLYASNAEGRLINGFEMGKADVYVTGRNFPAGSTIKVFMVERQFDWHEGDLIRPVTLASGRGGVETVRLGKNQTSFTIRLASSDEIVAGSYDFVARVYREGFYNTNEMTLQEEDVVSSRVLSSLVVRQNFYATKTVFGGCANAQDIAGRPISGQPYFKFTNSFPVGTDVWAALDPAGLDPSLIGKKAAIYVVPHKTAAQWSADPSLQHLAVLGGNSMVQEFITQASCINFNKRLVWPNPQIPDKYDIIIDFGNNPAQIANFAKDNTFNMPTDIIDGYFMVGFHVIDDPTTSQSFPFVGSFEYNEGSTTIDAPGETPVGTHSLEQKAVVYFPSAFAGATAPSDISAAQAQYPLVVVVHGNSSNINSYKGYNYLLEHLARNGFIAASIHIYPNAKGVSRARALFKHIEILKTKFPGKIDLNNIGIMGHSRGGEAVVIASKLNKDESLGYKFKAIISLAPTDQYGPYSLTGIYQVPYLIIYGSLDGDIAGGYKDFSGTMVPWPKSTGFSLYDRADPEKSMVFVERACHDRFNTEWDDNDFYFGLMTPADQSNVISLDAHQKIAKAYMNAFFRRHLYGKTEFTNYFTGEIVPPEVEAADGGMVKIHAQYQALGGRIVDAFNNLNWQLNDLNETVTHNNTLPTNPLEDDLASIDSHSPHDTKGGVVKWDATTGIYFSKIPTVNKDLSGYQTLSFRITQRYGSTSNPANTEQDLYVKLSDTNGNSRSIKVSKFTAIPYPYVRGYDILTKSALKTVRIPLSVFRIQVLGMVILDLTQVESITFEFKAKPTGEIEIDDIEFSVV